MWLLICPFKYLLNFNDILENYLSCSIARSFYVMGKGHGGNEVETILVWSF